MLAAAGALAVKQRGAHRAHRMHARADVPHRDHREERRPVRLAAHRSDARVGGAQPVESGFARKRPGLSKGRNRAHHDARIERLDGCVVETDAPYHSRCVIFDQDIDFLDEFLEDAEAFRLLRVDADAFFAAVVLNVIAAPALDHDERAARGIAVRREFDLDDLGAHLGEHQRAGRARNDLREVEHLVAVEDVPVFRHRYISCDSRIAFSYSALRPRWANLAKHLLRRGHHGCATFAEQCGALRRASVDRRLFLSTCTKRRSSFSQATVKISFVVNKLYTRKQGQYLAFIYYYTKLNGRAPSEADMRAYFHVTAPSVHQMVLTLAANGLVERVPKLGRSLRLLVPRAELPDLE